jgi:hypothetical protein
MARVNSKITIPQRFVFDGAEAGEGLAVFFSQNGRSATRWRCLVKAMIGEGVYDVGEFYISPPQATTIPGRLSRMVAGAICPGATSWSVEFSAVPVSGEVPAETSDIILASSRCLGTPGVNRVGERYAYHAGVNGNFTVLAGMKITGISALSTGAGTVVIAGGDTITIPSGSSANLAPEGSIPPNSLITFTNVDWLIEYLESA